MKCIAFGVITQIKLVDFVSDIFCCGGNTNLDIPEPFLFFVNQAGRFIMRDQIGQSLEISC